MSADHQVVIVGTGFSGIGMAARLKQAGIHNFVVFEKDDGVGGTWRANHYPGAACDVQSHLYSFSFEPNPNWSRMFAQQAEILAYLERCADRHGIRPHLRLNTEVREGRYDEQHQRWHLRLKTGETLTTRFLVTATGGLSRPAYPQIPGLTDFKGALFHTARWQDDFDLKNQRVGVIGTGASAIQVVPAIVDTVGALKLFQRTPPWILPKPDRAIRPEEQRRYARWPGLLKLARERLYWSLEARAMGFVISPRILRLAEQRALAYLEEQVADPALREQLTPSYRIGCKRILMSNDYFQALQRPHVELVTRGIKEVTPHGIATRDGHRYELDALVLATGFQTAEAVAPFALQGRRGVDLNHHWRDGAEAYLGTTVAGFPNLFILAGPNTGLGHSSMVFMLESQIHYAMGAIKLAHKHSLRELEVRSEVQARFNRELSARTAKTIWATGGCTSWYLTASGKNTTLWPGFTYDFRRRTAQFDQESYQLTPEPGR